MKRIERKKGEIVDRQNKRIKSYCTQSYSYGSMTFWKNVDFWKSIALYTAIIILFWYFIN
jgi:hypothetical protein